MPLTRPELRPVDPLLTNYALDFNQSFEGACQDVIFPSKGAAGETGTFFVYDANYKFRHYDDRRADPGEANAIGMQLTDDVFKCDEFALKTHVTDRERDQVLDPISLDNDATRSVTEALTLAREIRTRDLVADGTGTQTTITNKWDATAGNADPLQDVEVAQQAFQLQTGRRANYMIIAPIIWKIMKSNTTDAGTLLNERLKFTQQVTNTTITPQMVGNMFDIPNVKIADLLFTDTPLTNTATGGAGITSGEFIWDKDAAGTDTADIYLMYLDPNGGIKSLTYGWSFQSQTFEMSRYREDKLRTDWIEGGRIEKFKVVASACKIRMPVMT